MDKTWFEALIRENNVIKTSKGGMHYANWINANDKLKPMINELNQKINTGVVQQGQRPAGSAR